MTGDEFEKALLDAHAHSFEVAFETAVRTGTALVWVRNGKVVKVKPPYRYELVPIKPARKKKRIDLSRSSLHSDE